MPFLTPTNRRIARWLRFHPLARETDLRAALALPRGNPAAMRFEYGPDGRLHARRPWILAGLAVGLGNWNCEIETERDTE